MYADESTISTNLPSELSGVTRAVVLLSRSGNYERLAPLVALLRSNGITVKIRWVDFEAGADESSHGDWRRSSKLEGDIHRLRETGEFPDGREVTIEEDLAETEAAVVVTENDDTAKGILTREIFTLTAAQGIPLVSATPCEANGPDQEETTAVERAMPGDSSEGTTHELPTFDFRVHSAPFETRVKRFAREAGRLARPSASFGDKRRVLTLLIGFVAGRTWPDNSFEGDSSRGYGVHCLHDDPGGWTISTIVLENGGSTPPHDHGCWGAAATVRGAERNVTYTGTCPDGLDPSETQIYAPGSGYIFEAGTIHQASDATRQLTVSVHLLVQGTHETLQSCPEEMMRDLV